MGGLFKQKKVTELYIMVDLLRMSKILLETCTC